MNWLYKQATKYLTETFRTVIFLFITLFVPTISSAHEVYVLTPEQVNRLEVQPAVSFFSIFFKYVNDTLLWGGLIGFLLVSVFLISISATAEKKFDKYLVKIKRYAPFIARITAGLAFVSCAYHGALFGPELPMSTMFGLATPFIQGIFYILGIGMLLGVFSRMAGIFGLLIYLYAIFYNGFYMMTYLNYFAEFIVLILIGGHKFRMAEEHHILPNIQDFLDQLARRYGEFAFLILRIGFGVSLIYASVYAKILHNQLALEVVRAYDLTSVFGFPAEFIVFGAAIIEILLGIFFILGIEIRFNAIVLNVFLTLSLFYFGEAVWPHIILMGIPVAFFCYGYDKYSLEGFFFKKGNREPIF